LNDQMGLRLIAAVMNWPQDENSTANREYQWLRLMSAVKYDGYSDFRAGVRFLENLAAWLKQFDQEDRPVAYDFIKKRLVYISPPELFCLVETFVPEVVTPNLRGIVANELGVKPYEVWKTPSGTSAFNKRLRKTLFVALSDGSRIDIFRRAFAGRVSTEQVVPMLNIDNDKWIDLGENLVGEDGMGPKEKFDSVYLVDDFTASGTTFIRQVEGKWKGKLNAFNKTVSKAKAALADKFPIADNYALHVHHYISSHRARDALHQRLAETDTAWTAKTFGSWRITEGLLLPQDLELSEPGDAAILDLCDRYYDHALFERLRRHCEQAGMSTMNRGYANCALPVVLDHNTPNNSIPLLWADTEGTGGAHAMRSLFHRRDRHG